MSKRTRATRSQKISLAPDGVVVPGRMKPYSVGQAVNPPAVRISRLKQLIQSQEPNICVVRGEGLGDVITTTPAIHAIKQQFKKSYLTYATNTKYLDGALVEVLKYNPDIDQIIERQLLNDGDYDLVINLHCPCISHEKPGAPPISRIDLFARYLGLRLENPVPKYFLLRQEVNQARSRLGLLIDENIILVQPSASAERRSVDHKVLKQACIQMYKDYKVRSVFLTHSTDWKTDTLWDNVPGGAVFRNLTVREIAAVMVHCDLVLCPDSSILHLAGALRVPTVGLFGPTPPAARINHYQNAIGIWGGEGYKPCPCYYSVCPINQTCWRTITSTMIAETCIDYLKETNRVDRSTLPYAESDSIIDTEII